MSEQDECPCEDCLDGSDQAWEDAVEMEELIRG